MRFLRWWPYLLLVVALAGSLVAYPLLPIASEGPRGFALNLATEIVGILLTVGLIDAVLRRREDRERDRYRSVALRQLWQPLNRQLDLFSSIYKASAEQRPEREVSRASELFCEDFFRQAPRLDLTAASGTALRSAPDSFAEPERMPWYECIGRQMESFNRDLGHVIDKYAMYLDIDTVDAAERLMNSNFARVVQLGQEIASSARSMGIGGPVPLMFVIHPAVDDPVREYADALSELVGIYDRTAPEGRKVRISDSTWRDDIHPMVGSARISDKQIGDMTVGERGYRDGSGAPESDGSDSGGS